MMTLGSRTARTRQVLGEIVLLPEALQEIEPEVAPERFLDHLTVATAGPSGTDLDGLHDGLVDRESGAYLRRHIGIIARRCEDAETRPATGDPPGGLEGGADIAPLHLCGPALEPGVDAGDDLAKLAVVERPDEDEAGVRAPGLGPLAGEGCEVTAVAWRDPRALRLPPTTRAPAETRPSTRRRQTPAADRALSDGPPRRHRSRGRARHGHGRWRRR